jgi:rubrerythrin
MDEALGFAIGEEQAAADFYTRLAQRARTPGMKLALEDFAREEMNHKAKLEAVKAGGKLKPTAQRVADLKIADYVVDVSPDADLDYRGALIVAMKKERAAFKLYTDLARTATDKAVKATFLALAQEEANHKLRFEVEYDDMMAEG